MTTRIVLAACVVAWVAACSNAHSEDEMKVETRGHVPASQAADASMTEPQPEHELTEEDEAWLAVTDFEILFERTACFGTCPAYALRIDSSGALRFVGYEWVDKLGVHETQISAEDVRALYESIVRRGFLGFRPKYDLNDGCERGATDNPHSVFVIRANGREKSVDYYWGCMDDRPEFEVLEALDGEIVELTNARRFVEGPAAERCGALFRGFVPDTSYVIRNLAGAAQGLLRFSMGRSDFERTWSASTCEGEELSKGTRASQSGCGKVLFPPALTPQYNRGLVERVQDNNITLRWPGSEEPQAAIVLTPDSEPPATSPDAPVTALELRLIGREGETMQRAVAGERCEK